MQKINLIITLYGICGIRNTEKTSYEYSVYLGYSETPVFDPKIGFFCSFLLVLLVLCFTKFDFDGIQKIWNTEYGIYHVSIFEKIRNLENSTFRRALVCIQPHYKRSILTNKNPKTTVCHGFRLMKQVSNFWVDFDHFWASIVFRGSLGNIKNWLKP